jgi:predicted transposase YbfD/YdcC
MESVLAIFASIEDPRDHTAQYDLSVLLFIALAATLCGARSCVDIADFAEGNRADLIDIVVLAADTTPSHDTFSRLFRLLDPEQLEAALRRFSAAMREGLGLGPAEGVVAVDGKRLRRGYERGRAHMPPLMVGVWDAETRLSLAACAGANGNEVAATLAALKTVSLKGCTVTGDALHCHPEMARHVRAQGGDYLLKLKANHGPLLAAAKAAFAAAEVAGTLKWSAAAAACSPCPRRRRPFRVWRRSAASTASERKTAVRPKARRIIWSCRNACQPGGCWPPRDGTGAWRTTSTVSSTWCSVRTTREHARTTRPAICPSSGVWRWTCCARIRSNDPSRAK